MGRFCRKLADIVSCLDTWPFAEPKIAVLYGTFAGIVLAVGLDFVLGIFTDGAIKPWGLKQTAGIILVTTSIMISLVAWSLQLFDNRLAEKGKRGASLEEKSAQFRDWGGRWFTRVVSLLALMMLISAAGLLTWIVTSQL